MIKEEIKNLISKATGISADDFSVEIPTNKDHGDYSTNVAMVLKKNPDEIAKKVKSDLFSKVEVKNGFINFFVKDEFFVDKIKKIDKNFGKGVELRGRKVMIDYTDPNLFKTFHIGHLMSNAIGESLSRIFEFQGAKIKRICYQGDVSINIAKAMWGILQNKDNLPGEKASLDEKMAFLSKAYAEGDKKYKESEDAKSKIRSISKKIYEHSDREINFFYEKGKKWSLQHFDQIYKKLGTKFDYLILETQVAEKGKKIVERGLSRGIFEKGENGATIFRGDKSGLHTRVFINSEGFPTYEGKDLGLAQFKYEKFPYDLSFIVTANEQKEYFEVMLMAMELALPNLAQKTKHIGHGAIRLPEGKMTSRAGNVVTGESLIEKVKELVEEKIKDKGLSDEEKKEISEKVAVGAIKYSILKQSIGSDIIYDFDKSISFEGDSGPYLQYAYTRAQSVLRKAKDEGMKPSFKKIPTEITQLEKTMSYFPETVLRASKGYEPHFLVLYLTELAATFNAYYAENRIIDKSDEFSSYKVALTAAFAEIMKNGLWLLGIETLEKM